MKKTTTFMGQFIVDFGIYDCCHNLSILRDYAT